MNHTRRVSRRYPLASREDLWDETVTALVRAAVHYAPELGHFVPYAQTCVHRALWRYCVRPMYGSGTHGLRDLPVPWHDVSEARTPNDGVVHGMRGTHPPELHVASAETVYAALEPYDHYILWSGGSHPAPTTTSCGARRTRNGR